MVLRGRTRITRKGQITIPAAIREALGLREGDSVELTLDERGTAVTLMAPRSIVESTRGILRRDGQPSLTDRELKRAIQEAAHEAAIARDERTKTWRLTT